MEPPAPRLALLALALALALPQLGWACSPPLGGQYSPPTTEEKIHFSDVVVHGRVTRRLAKSENWPDTAYSVSMQVLCVFKSPPDAGVKSQIVVHNAGYVPGLCHSTNLTEGMEYVAYLNIVDGKYEPSYSEVTADPQFLEDFSFYCEVKIAAPSDSANSSCPPAYDDYDDCMAYVPPTDPPVVSPPIPPQPEPSDKPYPEPGPVITTPKTQVKIVSSDTMADEQGHAIHTHHTPTNGDNGAGEGDNSEETVAVAGFKDKDNGSDVPLLSSLLVAACLLVALAAKG